MNAYVDAQSQSAQSWKFVSTIHHDDDESLEASTVVPRRLAHGRTSRSVRELAEEVRAALRERARDPEQILEGRRRFYMRHGGARGELGYGESELAFTGWLLRRGSLGGSGQPRSIWWSGVNFDLAFHSELAAALVEHGVEDDDDVPAAVRPWLTYIDEPCALSWYRAHNDSVVRSYIARAHEAQREPLLEQRFMGRVLIRVLCVQGIHELGGQVPFLSRVADPRSEMVERVLGVRLLYPVAYPIAPGSLEGAAQSAVDLVESLIWSIGLEALFRAAGRWLELPALSSLVQDGRLYYPCRAKAHCALSDYLEVPA